MDIKIQMSECESLKTRNQLQKILNAALHQQSDVSQVNIFSARFEALTDIA